MNDFTTCKGIEIDLSISIQLPVNNRPAQRAQVFINQWHSGASRARDGHTAAAKRATPCGRTSNY